MFKKLVSAVVILISALFFSCTEDQSTNPVQLADNGNQTGGLAKRIWNTSQVYDWPQDSGTGMDGKTYYYSREYYNLYFDNFYFHLEFSGGSLNGDYTQGSVSVSVNNQYTTTVSWSDPKYSPTTGWIGWVSFSYNNISMSININKGIASNFGSGDVVAFYTEPKQVQIQVQDIVAPDAPTGFSVSPRAHNNLNQAVTISWDISADTDVTGYKIYRSLQTSPSTWTLVQTINSRTTSSWIDTTVPWSLSNPEMTVAYYKMVAYDGTHNLTSAYTASLDSSMP